jgi:aminoglycoside phosphotransferase (APT) family kinase protein
VPVPDQRDPESTRQILQEWLARQLPAADSVVVDAVQTPANTGFSSETLMFEAAWRERGQATGRRERLVAKVAPTGHQIFPEPRFDEQVALLRILANTEIPVPILHWHDWPFGPHAPTGLD